MVQSKRVNMAFVKGSRASLIYQSPLTESIKHVGNTDLFDTICLVFQKALKKLPASRLLRKLTRHEEIFRRLEAGRGTKSCLSQ